MPEISSIVIVALHFMECSRAISSIVGVMSKAFHGREGFHPSVPPCLWALLGALEPMFNVRQQKESYGYRHTVSLTIGLAPHRQGITKLTSTFGIHFKPRDCGRWTQSSKTGSTTGLWLQKLRNQVSREIAQRSNSSYCKQVYE